MKCLCCQELLVADRRNRGRQKFCAKPECRKASKRHSQARWLSHPENQNHFRDPSHCERVREWRARNPGYWKRNPRKQSRTLQDPCLAQRVDSKAVATQEPEDLLSRTLQDLCRQQIPLFVGLVAQLVDSPLQDDIANHLRALVARGCDLLGMSSGSTRTQNPYRHDIQNSSTTRSTPADSPELQLGGSSTGTPKPPP